MATVLAIVLGVTTAICGIGWLVSKVTTKAVILYFLRKENTLPTEEEVDACCKEAIRRMFGLKP